MNASSCSSQSPAAPAAQSKTGLFGQPHLLFPNLYLSFVLLAMIDLMLTCELLSSVPSARELNPFAAAMILEYDLFGLVAYKSPMTALNVMLIEAVGRLRHRTGYRLAVAAVIIAAIPPLWLFLQMLNIC